MLSGVLADGTDRASRATLSGLALISQCRSIEQSAAKSQLDFGVSKQVGIRLVVSWMVGDLCSNAINTSGAEKERENWTVTYRDLEDHLQWNYVEAITAIGQHIIGSSPFSYTIRNAEVLC
ncbi:uncharacterized protein MELLADRAFT_108087 [Melampsora larici-populina 98AG31]|uniref:Uncharacterized protein n=1 Tax=Melampsora larici-populina (strain 98AG31 / pathotype 3-4-7) TaxID=747676 RepID=F4RRX7_MELLP|nr:uncharacterized protein MELLADRAFT_108087 [Melampsora larici-populina 98AG31]EGG04874.1 hypothetical protein MELLADRAFT_108087 [Melampsora larici-populina 98AG31]